MAERVRSKDGRRETEELLGDDPENLGSPSGQGRSGGEINRKVGTRDEERNFDDSTPGKIRPTAGDRDNSGDKEGV